jgi:hypothetical protein
VRGIFRDDRHELESARPCAHHADALALQIDRSIPARRVEARPGKVLAAGNVRVARHIQLADGTHEDVRHQLPAGGVDVPFAAGLVPVRLLHARVEARDLVEAVGLREPLEIGEQHVALAVEFGPIVVRLEAVGI